MKKLMMLMVVLLMGSMIYAQPPGMPGNGKMQAAPTIGIVYGKLVDANGKAVPDASVMLMSMKMDTVARKMKEVLLKASTTKAGGTFRFEDLPIFGPLSIKITATGYEPIERKFSFVETPAGGSPAGAPPAGKPAAAPTGGGTMPNFEKDLGKLTMKVQPTEMQNITIVGSKPALKMDIDKKVFNVEKNIVSAGGTAVDVMKNVPSLNVDIDGNVTLRNASPQIYVDGRPTTLTLDQIPADAIESVEVITNPSAKYDASGGNAGILNIVLKKNKKSGYNGNVSLGVDKRGGINGGAGLNIRQDKFNFSLNGFTNQMKNRGTGETHMEDLLSNPTLLVDQYTNSKNSGGFMFGKAGLDYFATDRSTFSVGIIRVHGSFNPTENMVSDSSYSNANYKSYSERYSNTSRQFNATGFSAGYKYIFPRQGEELTADINVFQGKSDYDQKYDTYIYDAKGGSGLGEQHQQILGDGTNRFTTIQTDYVRP
ncbi:MAG TPA: TonB-dependent receptor, partial [Chitinophagaceae bacterium]|nr:TonB-dependent receptor [Chitinophagaceae bacterium]